MSRPIIHTPHGHELGDVVSALQKSIRRGNVDDAIYFAVEMDLAGYGGYLWNRLRIIASEDVGPAAPDMAVLVRSLYENWKEMKDKNSNCPERLFIVQSVMALSEAVKTRIVDNATIVHYADHDGLRREIPDYALDRHTRRGRMMKRGAQHFFTESVRLYPEAVYSDPYKDRAREVQEAGLKLPPPVKLGRKGQTTLLEE